MSLHHLPFVPSVCVFVLPSMVSHRRGGLGGGGLAVPHTHSAFKVVWASAHVTVDVTSVLKYATPAPGMTTHPGGMLKMDCTVKAYPLLFA